MAKTSAKKRTVTGGGDLASLFAALRAILEPYARSFKVTNQREHYGLDDHSIRGHVISFAAVVMKRGRVSFYLLPLIWSPELLKDASPKLLEHRTKAGGFFNFKAIDHERFSELTRLVRRAVQTWDPAAIVKS
jgi:hypothetical protein